MDQIGPDLQLQVLGNARCQAANLLSYDTSSLSHEAEGLMLSRCACWGITTIFF